MPRPLPSYWIINDAPRRDEIMNLFVFRRSRMEAESKSNRSCNSRFSLRSCAACLARCWWICRNGMWSTRSDWTGIRPASLYRRTKIHIGDSPSALRLTLYYSRTKVLLHTGWHKKLAHNFSYALTLPNRPINRFSKLFHYQNREKNCNNTLTKDPTTPQVCRYNTLWNVSVLKATIENKTISVRTHFNKLTTGNNVFIVSVIV